MAAVWYRARAELRRRWRAALGLALLVGLVGAVTLTVVAGARRSASAFSRFQTTPRSGDVTLYASDPGRLQRVEGLAQVEAVGRIFAPLVVPPDTGATGGELTIVASPDVSLLSAVDRVRVIVANLIAAVPAALAGRTPAAAVLRSE